MVWNLHVIFASAVPVCICKLSGPQVSRWLRLVVKGPEEHLYRDLRGRHGLVEQRLIWIASGNE